MLKIAICDDELNELEENGRLLEEYASNHQCQQIEIIKFTRGQALLDSIADNGPYSLYLLDIVMPKKDGIQLGMEIRRWDKNAVIIYLTISPDYALDSYIPRAFYYLLKPVKKKQLFSVLEEALSSQAKIKTTGFTVKTKDAVTMVPIHTIVYAELVGRSIWYYLNNDTVLTSVTLRGAFRKEVAPLLEESQFVLTATSFMVNLEYVTSIEKQNLILQGGKRIPLSRTYQIEVKQQWMDHWLM